MHDLKVWANLEADGSIPSTTPGKISGKDDDMGRLAKVNQVVHAQLTPSYLFLLQELINLANH